jgi:CheY-like chemotaxis protein
MSKEVLVIDDNSDIRQLISGILKDHNSTILFNSIKDGAKVEIIMPKDYD